jgi:hypothetical protein
LNLNNRQSRINPDDTSGVVLVSEKILKISINKILI